MQLPISGLVQCLMGKPVKSEARAIYLSEWLDAFKMKVIDAAKIAGCSQGYLSNIMRGERPNVNVLYLLRLSEAMQITVNDFYRKPPSVTQLAPLTDLSPQARQAIMNRKRG